MFAMGIAVERTDIRSDVALTRRRRSMLGILMKRRRRFKATEERRLEFLVLMLGEVVEEQ